ncbi:AsmA family protein [Roseococcus pinisoli]|uniref:AsmA family protein n=1 Tax=Roseococcus pinisoli TaxID=2835040 RepID=A0ABS5QIM6_9PROT|nr:AsmA family protein [Roseococcus pinisoli]MBS7813541.1 AsmA family protein [Roseococcus pinisoli]
MKRLASARGLTLALVLGLAGAAAAGAYVVPKWLDWDRHSGTIAAIASERLGRPVWLEGPVTLELLPQPRLEASRVVIGQTGDDVRMSARALRLRLDLGALLLGRIKVRELALVGADIRLPWPPTSLPALAPLPRLTALDARLEESRISIGGALLEGVSARLTAGSPAEALTAEGALVWRGRPVRFQATLGRAGDDGIAPLDVSASHASVNLQARGALLAEGGFEGRLEISGPDLAAVLPAPPGPFRATSSLVAGAEVLTARQLALEVGGQSVRGSALLRLGREPRFDLTLATPRLEVEPWLAALRGAGPQAVPVSLDISAEGATLGPLRLRKLRGAAFLQGERLTLTDVSAELPGETTIELSGASAGPRLDLALRWRSARAEQLAEAIALPARQLLPPGTSEGQLRLSWEGTQVTATDLTAQLGPTRATGGFVWRQQSRPTLALGLDFDRLEAGLTPAELLASLREAGANADFQLRLGFDRLSLGPSAWERVAVDGAVENGRLLLRRLAGRHLGLDVALAGTLAADRVSDLTLEAEGLAGPLLARLGLERPGLAGLPLRLRASGAGPLDALPLRVEGDLSEARIESQATIDVAKGLGQGTFTLRHPGAARMIGVLTERPAPQWLGEGSFSLIASLARRPEGWSAESFDVVAGQLRGRGQLALGEGGAATGRLALERLPLPAWRDLELGAWSGPALDVALTAERVEPLDLPALEQASAQLRTDAATLRIEELRANIAGGTLAGALRLERGPTARVSAEGSFSDVVLDGPLTGRPVDISAGRLSGEFRLNSAGNAPAALVEGLGGEARLNWREGVLQGLDGTAAAAALRQEDLRGAEAGLRAALQGGATAIQSATASLSIAGGTVTVDEATLEGDGGAAMRLGGQVDLARDVLGLRVTMPVAEGAPDVGLRLTGPSQRPRRLVEVAQWLRWRAEHSP